MLSRPARGDDSRTGSEANEFVKLTALLPIVAAAQRFLDLGASAYVRDGTRLLDAANVSGFHFAVRVILPTAHVRVDTICDTWQAARLSESRRGVGRRYTRFESAK